MQLCSGNHSCSAWLTFSPRYVWVKDLKTSLQFSVLFPLRDKSKSCGGGVKLLPKRRCYCIFNSLYCFCPACSGHQWNTCQLLCAWRPCLPPAGVAHEDPHTSALTPERESFSIYLKAARTSVQRAFWRLKSRWWVLLKRSDFHFTFSLSTSQTIWPAVSHFVRKKYEQGRTYKNVH